MGIKMGSALDRTGNEWHADTYQKGMGAEPLKCLCGVAVTHNPSHTRELHDKSVFVSAYFRLLPGGEHAANCRYGVQEEIEEIAKESQGLVESVKGNQYRMRLVMIKEALEGGAAPKIQNGEGPKTRSSKTYVSSSNKLPAYINSAKRALKLRALCASDNDVEQHLELVFEGNTAVNWRQFYFETERHMEAFYAVSQNTTQHPIAIHGYVKSVRRCLGDDKAKNVLNLRMNKYRADTENPENAVGLEVSIWSRQTAWFKGIENDDEVVVLGMWKATTTLPTAAPNEGRFKTFTKNRLSLSLVLMAQITKV
jgi:hypothetical protein